MMSKTFHGKVEETVDALIILEACRQGVMPRITRRLLAAERGETRPPPNLPSETPSSSSLFSTRMSSRLSASASVGTTAPFSSSSLSSATAYSSSSALSSASTTPSPTATVSSSSTTTNPSLIVPGSVFVFDEEESGICRWTDGKIWSPSRICGNFLVYRELYRKLPNQKCYTTSDKSKMKDGFGLKDQALRDKVDKENLVVMGCMKGTFVLKKGGLIKKTICVKGINLISPEEMKRRLEGPTLGLSSSERRGGRAGGGGGGGGTGRNLLPGFSIRGTQHLVCYEMPGDHLHSPREYLELRDLPISKTFVMMQSYRVPIQILPLDFGQQPLDPADEYIHSSRIFEARAAKQSTPLSSSNTAVEGPVKRRRTRGGRQRKRVEEESSESDGEPDYLVNETNNNDDGAYYDWGMMTVSRPILPPIAPSPSSPPPPAVAPVYHNYPTRGQDRYIRERIRQQLIEPWSPSPPTDSTSKGKKRKIPLSRSLAMETEDTSAVKIEKCSPSLECSHSGGRSAESGVFLQHGIGVKDKEISDGQYGAAPVMATSSLATRNTSSQMQELLQSMNTTPLQSDNELQVHGYKTAEGEWRLATSPRSTSSSSATNDTLAYVRSTYSHGYDQPQLMSAYPYHEEPQWQQQQQRSWDFVAYDQMNLRRTYSSLYPAQQHSITHCEPQSQLQLQDELQYQTPRQQQAYSHETMACYDTAPVSITMMPPMQDLQGYYNHNAGAGHYKQSFSLGSNTTPATTSDVGRHAGDTELEFSDDAGYSPVQQPLAHMERGDSPWSSGSVRSRSSSLSTSLTLSPVVRTQTHVGQDGGGPSAVSEAENQPSTSVQIANERRDDGGIHTPSDYSARDDRPLCDRQPVIKQTQSSMTTTSSSNQGQTVSVSFTHTARGSSSHTGSSSALIQAPATMAMPTPSLDLVHMGDSTVNPGFSASVTSTVNINHQVQWLSSPTLQVSQQTHDHSFNSSCRPFHQHPQSYVPVMSFSSGTILGTCAADSRQKSPISPREDAMRSVASVSKPQDCLALLEGGANEPPSQEQEQFATDEDKPNAEPFPSRRHVSPSPETPTQSSIEGPFSGDDTTTVTMATSLVQRSSYSAAGPFRESVEASPLSHQLDSELYSPQPHREYIHPPSFLFQDLDDRDELDRLLDYHSHQVDMLEHDEEGAVEVHADDDERSRETGEYDNQGSERTIHQTTPPPINLLTESESQTSKEPQLMSPGTLSTLHHYSQEGPSSMRGIGSDPSAGCDGPAAPCLSMVSSSGSLGQDEYLLHQARPHITKMHIRRYGHGANNGTGVATSLGVGFENSEGCGYVLGSDGGRSNGGLKSIGPGAGSRVGVGTGTDSGGQYDRSEDLPWAMSRQEDTTSSEIACQLFSGLGPSRGRGGEEGHGYASSMGVGIGTAIGSSHGGGSVHLVGHNGGHGSDGSSEAVDRRTRSVQTLQLSDPAERYSFDDGQEESPSRFASLSSKQQQQEEEEQEEKSGYIPHQQQQVLQRDRSHVANRLNDTSLIEQEEVEDAEEEEVLGLYSEYSSERASSVQEIYDDDNGDGDEDMDQGYDGPAQQEDIDFAEGQVSGQGDGGYEANDVEILEDLPSSQESTESEDLLPK
ncbi:hypothetical protein BGZ47_007902 [Haplosporangium gracile]|nr:hypothetical protein BGZ47_007902 [Haplosporangium gracile]